MAHNAGIINFQQLVLYTDRLIEGQNAFLHETEGTLHLKATALDNADNEIKNREFEVPLKQRMITKLTGPYFSGSDGSTIS